MTLGLLLTFHNAHAGGLFLPGLGAVSTMRAGAFVATADDPSALMINPAGLAKQSGTTVLMSTSLIDYSLTYQRSGVYDAMNNIEAPWEGQAYAPVEDETKPAIGIGGFQAIPVLAVATDLGLGVRGLRFGFGVAPPSNAFPGRSMGADYTLESPTEPPPASRYDIVEQDATVVLPSVGVAYELFGKLDLGARFAWGFGHVKATTYVWGIRNYEEAASKDSIFKVDASDNFVPVFTLGAMYRPIPALEVAATYTSQADVEGRGEGSSITGSALGLNGTPEVLLPRDDGNCAPGGTRDALKACINVSLPQHATLGARYILRDEAGAERADVELNVHWENWGAVSDYKVVVDGIGELSGTEIQETFIRHGLQDTYAVRLGGGYRLPVGAATVALRGGVAYDTAAATENWRRADFDGASRVTTGLGASYRAARFQVDIGGGYIFEPTDEVASNCNPAVIMEGCSGDGMVTPVVDRNAPDPVQPLIGPGNQKQSPHNDGTYESGYLVLTFGVSTWF